MKKIIICSLIILILSGCTVNYDLEFENDLIKEKLELDVTENDYAEYISKIEKDDVEENMYKFFEAFEIPNDIKMPNQFHKKESKRSNDNINLKFTYDNYDYESFNSSYILNNCFYDVVVLNEENDYYISAKGPLACPLNDANIRIKTDRKVINTNAKYENGYYTWDITEDDYENIELYFHISKTEPFNEIIEEEKTNYNFIWIIILTLGLVVLFYLLKKQNNKLY